MDDAVVSGRDVVVRQNDEGNLGNYVEKTVEVWTEYWLEKGLVNTGLLTVVVFNLVWMTQAILILILF